MLVIIKDPSTS